MTGLTVSAVRLVDGREIPLPNLVSLAVTGSLESPAWGMSLAAAVDAFPGELGKVTVREGPRVIFSGRVDRQASELSAAGRLLRLEARSKGALLLDNEAAPCTLTGAGIATVFGRLIAPYGFGLYNPAGSRYLPLYTVHKGQSEWEAFAGFVRRTLSRTPTVSGDQVLLDRPRSAAPLVVGEGGIPFTELRHTSFPCRILSRVVLRDADGWYRSAVRNGSAAYYGVERKRYAIPPSEFVDNPGLDANQRIRRSMLQKETVSVTLPGLVQTTPGREARIAGEELSLGNLLIRDLTWRQDENGLTTDLELVSAQYWD